MRILFVSTPEIVHTARWIDQLADQEWELHLFSPEAISDLTIHKGLPSEVLVHLIVQQNRHNGRQTGIRLPTAKGDRLRLAITNAVELFRTRADRLADVIENVKPDIVHSLQMQGASYLTLEAKKILTARSVSFPKWIYSSWGSDIYMYLDRDDHMPRISEVLANIDYLITDCRRDVDLATEYGFKGQLLGIIPTGGGFEVGSFESSITLPVSTRRVIALKGLIRPDKVGRALVALEGIEKCRSKLHEYEILIYSADGGVIEKAQQMNDEKGMKVRILPSMSHDAFVRFLGRARINIGLNISDGTPNTMLEGMMMGAFPIQSDTISTREWIENGRNGFLVDPDSSDEVANAVAQAIDDDSMVEKAGLENTSFIKNNWERRRVQDKVIGLYRIAVSNEDRANISIKCH